MHDTRRYAADAIDYKSIAVGGKVAYHMAHPSPGYDFIDVYIERPAQDEFVVRVRHTVPEYRPARNGGPPPDAGANYVAVKTLSSTREVHAWLCEQVPHSKYTTSKHEPREQEAPRGAPLRYCNPAAVEVGRTAEKRAMLRGADRYERLSHVVH